jgi:hypothetical protein
VDDACKARTPPLRAATWIDPSPFARIGVGHPRARKTVTLISTLFIMYWLPTIIAIARQAHSALGVFLLNFFLGWTVIGWILALIWSLAADNRMHEVIVRVDRNDYSPRP